MRNSNKRGFTLVEIMIVVLIIGILAAIAIPNFVRARESARQRTCIANLKQMEGGIQQWAIDTRQPPTAAPNAAAIFGPTPTHYVRTATAGTLPQCPSNGVYGLGATVADRPTCNQAGHVLP